MCIRDSLLAALSVALLTALTFPLLGAANGWLVVLFILAVTAALFPDYRLWRRAERVDTCHFAPNGMIYLRTKSGRRMVATLRASFVHPYLVVICLRASDKQLYCLTLPRFLFAENCHRALRERVCAIRR